MHYCNAFTTACDILLSVIVWPLQPSNTLYQTMILSPQHVSNIIHDYSHHKGVEIQIEIVLAMTHIFLMELTQGKDIFWSANGSICWSRKCVSDYSPWWDFEKEVCCSKMCIVQIYAIGRCRRQENTYNIKILIRMKL